MTERDIHKVTRLQNSIQIHNTVMVIDARFPFESTGLFRLPRKLLGMICWAVWEHTATSAGLCPPCPCPALGGTASPRGGSRAHADYITNMACGHWVGSYSCWHTHTHTWGYLSLSPPSNAHNSRLLSKRCVNIWTRCWKWRIYLSKTRPLSGVVCVFSFPLSCQNPIVTLGQLPFMTESRTLVD